jgi:hypothetical protein
MIQEAIFTILFLVVAGLIGTIPCLVKWSNQKKREKDHIHKQVSEAIAKITADGKIEGPKGRPSGRRWGRKWVDYANSIPTPSVQSKQMPRVKELPSYPHIDDD